LLIERPHCIDPANAARTQLWNLESGQWDPNLLHWFGLPAEPLPACVPTCHNYGHLRVNGIDLPLKLMTGDQSAALYAYGQPRVDTAYVNIGSGAFVQRPVGSAPVFTQRLLSSIVMRDREQASYVLEGTVNGAATALDWFTEEVGLTDWQRQLPQWLAQDSAPPLFLNGVSGLAAPFWVPGFRSRFIGTGKPWEQVVAVIESIVFLLQANIDEMRIVLPAPERMLVTGGLAGLDGLCRRLAALSGLPVYRPAVHEATARGSAYILADCPDHWPEQEPGQWFHPQNDAALVARYRQWTEALMTALAKEK
jgi:glycerol kinase